MPKGRPSAARLAAQLSHPQRARSGARYPRQAVSVSLWLASPQRQCAGTDPLANVRWRTVHLDSRADLSQ